MFVDNPTALNDPVKIQEIVTEYKDFTLYLYQQYQGSGKKFLIGNSELDHGLYGGSVFLYVNNSPIPCALGESPPCTIVLDGQVFYNWKPYVDYLYSSGRYGTGITNPYGAAQTMAKLLIAAQRGVFEGRKQAAKNGWAGVEVYYVPEIVSVSLLQDHNPSLYSVLSLLGSLDAGLDSEGEPVPRFDFVSYSAYDAANRIPDQNGSLQYSDFMVNHLDRMAITLGSGNILVGEVGYSYVDYNYDQSLVESKAKKIIQDALATGGSDSYINGWRHDSLVPGVAYFTWWSLQDDGVTCSPNTSCFGLYNNSGNLQGIGLIFRDKLKP